MQMTLEQAQDAALEIVKIRFMDHRGYLHSLQSRLGIEITKLKESKNPTPTQIGQVFFLAEFVNTELEDSYDTYCRPGSDIARKATNFMKENPEFKANWKELKEERDQLYGMLFDWLETQDKSKIRNEAEDYFKYLLRFAK